MLVEWAHAVERKLCEGERSHVCKDGHCSTQLSTRNAFIIMNSIPKGCLIKSLTKAGTMEAKGY